MCLVTDRGTIDRFVIHFTYLLLHKKQYRKSLIAVH